jgi:hypothetical protein
VSWTDPHLESFTRLHGVDPGLSEDASMKKGVAGPVREFDEAKALVGIEPFDDAVDRWTGRRLEPGLAEPRSGAEGTGVQVVRFHVGVATLRMTKILISQLWFLVGSCPISQIERLAVALLQI